MDGATNNLVIGLGEVGSAIRAIFQCPAHDSFKNEISSGTFDTIHICIPYNKGFIKQVKEYQKKFKPNLTIIHSSVPVGTSDKLGAVHSPIRGVHPNLEKGVRTFVKFFGGKQAQEASKLFSDKGVTTYCVKDARTTEASKLWDTSQYGLMIVLNKEIYKYCEKNKVDFNVVYTLFNKTYNDGYIKLGRQEVTRPYLNYIDGKIGGHCVLPNLNLLGGVLAKFIKKYNDKI